MNMARMNPRLVLIAVLTSCGGPSSSTIAPPPAAQEVEGSAHGEAVAKRDPALEVVPPTDPRIRKGVLDNGLTYYVLHQARPERRAQLWLGVDTGSVMENEDQLGLAHFVEHMAFNGTENFEKMAIVNYLESIGMQFGPDVNAYTSFDETVYMLQLPTDDGQAMAKGLAILREWAGRVTFDAKEVDNERGVVLEEWRLGRGAFRRILDKQYPVLFKGSKYASRLPIGKKHIIETAPRDTLVRFYEDWYRPDLMAVVAVGDFDVDAMEKDIIERFGDLKKPAKARSRAAVEVPRHKETLVSIETDPEMPRTTVSIYNKFPHRPERTVGDYRRIIAEGLYHSMLNARFDEIGQGPDAPFVYAGSSTSSIVRTADAFVRVAMVKEGRLDDALLSLSAEVARVERHGFTAGELARAKTELLRGYQRSVVERDKKESRELAAEILRNYFEDELMPGVEFELELVERFLPTITVDELNLLARKWSGEDNRVVWISGPEKMKKPTEASVLALIDSVDKQGLAPYEDAVSAAPLMADKPVAGKVVGERTIPEIGATEWKLSNGATVVLKPTDFKNDEVRWTAFSPGGHSLVPDADFDTARFASSIVASGGVASFDKVQLQKMLKGKVVSVRTWIGELEEGAWGSASPRDLETMMQLLHLRFTAPRVDEGAFEAWRSGKLEFVRNRRLSPERAFFEDMGSFLSRDHLRRKPVTPETLDRIDLGKAHEIYKERFSDASDFTFVLVGNIDLPSVKPLVESYIASLPANKRKESWKDVGVKLPRGVKRYQAKQGKEPKSYVYVAFHGRQKWSRDAANDLDMLTEVLRIRLREVLREDMGGVYSAQVWGAISRRPRTERMVGIFFGCAPENVEKLRRAVFDEIGAIRKKGIGDDYIEKVKNLRTRTHQTDIKENNYWTRELARAWRFGDDPNKILEYQELIDRVSARRVKAAARKFARKNQYVIGVLRPED